MKLNKLKNVKVRVNISSNPYKAGSFKQLLFKWALEQREFSKQEFFDALLTLKAEFDVTSKMADDTLQVAWWNEFKNKHKVFEVIQ